MKRISITILCLFILVSMVEPVNHNLAEYHQEDNSGIEDNRNYGSVVTLTNDDECDDLNEDGVCDEKGMVGLKLDCCSDGEIFALVAFVAIFAGIPTYLIFRKLWKIVKKRVYVKRQNMDINEDDVFNNRSLGSDLPVTEKEFVRWKKGKDTGRNRHKNKFNLKEELLILSIYLFAVYLIWNNGI